MSRPLLGPRSPDSSKDSAAPTIAVHHAWRRPSIRTARSTAHSPGMSEAPQSRFTPPAPLYICPPPLPFHNAVGCKTYGYFEGG